MFLTRVLSAKSKHVSVLIESIATGHQMSVLRERKDDKLEAYRYDPLIRKKVIYVEIKKLKGVDCKKYNPINKLEDFYD